ncbi:MAG TPA: 4Fe-4S binding protein [Vicinamibacterales bacterium]|jgi:Pyruvate/2-oxoacid:ferredoxin oxidoreductase delta subunit
MGDSAVKRSIGRSIVLTVPMFLWALLMFSRVFAMNGLAPKLGGLATLIFMVVLFFLMLKTGRTHRWRRVFFVAMGVLFPVGFIAALVAERGAMSISVEQMLLGNTPFCFLAIPMMIVPAALTRTIIFPGSILPTASNPHAIAAMVGLWLAATIVLGKGWCAFACFFGGIEEGCAAIRRKPVIRRIAPAWRWGPWGVLAAIVLLSAATFEPTYCAWLCPFKAVTEFPAVRSFETAVQFGIFTTLFAGLVVALPVMTKKRTQCAFFCPFGAFQSVSNKLSVFDIRIDRSKCLDCVACRESCPTLSIDAESTAKGVTRMSCTKCGACVDTCKKGAAVWHVKGTTVGVKPERARLLYLYAAWAFATMFGGSIIANSVQTILSFGGVR